MSSLIKLKVKVIGNKDRAEQAKHLLLKHGVAQNVEIRPRETYWLVVGDFTSVANWTMVVPVISIIKETIICEGIELVIG